MSERRTRTTIVYLTPTEKRILKQLARRFECSESALLRFMFLHEADKRGISPPSKDDRDAYRAWWDEYEPNYRPPDKPS